MKTKLFLLSILLTTSLSSYSTEKLEHFTRGTSAIVMSQRNTDDRELTIAIGSVYETKDQVIIEYIFEDALMHKTLDIFSVDTISAANSNQIILRMTVGNTRHSKQLVDCYKHGSNYIFYFDTYTLIVQVNSNEINKGTIVSTDIDINVVYIIFGILLLLGIIYLAIHMRFLKMPK